MLCLVSHGQVITTVLADHPLPLLRQFLKNLFFLQEPNSLHSLFCALDPLPLHMDVIKWGLRKNDGHNGLGDVGGSHDTHARKENNTMIREWNCAKPAASPWRTDQTMRRAPTVEQCQQNASELKCKNREIYKVNTTLSTRCRRRIDEDLRAACHLQLLLKKIQA